MSTASNMRSILVRSSNCWKIIGCILMILMSFDVCGQENKGEDAFKKNRLSVAITHTLVPTAVSESGGKTWLSLASWGLDYDHAFNKSWGIGLHSDAVVQNFRYKDGDIFKERNSPVSLAFVGSRKFGEHFTVLAGGGAEFSSGEETLGLIRIGVDYGWEIPHDWEVAFSLLTDLKIGAYNAIVFGFGIGKKF